MIRQSENVGNRGTIVLLDGRVNGRQMVGLIFGCDFGLLAWRCKHHVFPTIYNAA
jgi:hypothetical protein